MDNRCCPICKNNDCDDIDCVKVYMKAIELWCDGDNYGLTLQDFLRRMINETSSG